MVSLKNFQSIQLFNFFLIAQHIFSFSLFRIPEIYEALKEVAKVQVDVADRDEDQFHRFVRSNIFEYKTGVRRFFTSHPSQPQHSCLEEVNEEDRTYRIKHAISQCSSGMISMVFACNGIPIPCVDVKTVIAMYGTEIILR